MKIRALSILAAGLGLWLGSHALAQSPLPQRSVGKISNQELADNVASALQKSGNLRGYTIDITAVDGVVELSGQVSGSAQRDAVLNTALSQPGVKSVIDSLNNAGNVRKVQALAEAGPGAPPSGPAMLPAPAGVPIVDPIPLGQPGAATPYDLNAPKLPPNAWPTYAPHNNFSRVAYPQQYPYNAFPFIGPFYPFPKVPMGWRSVTLEWQDGHWWLGRNGTQYDYWRVRYW